MDPAGFSESPENRVTSAGVFAAQLRDTGWWPEPEGVVKGEATQDPVQCGIVLITNEGEDGLGKANADKPVCICSALFQAQMLSGPQITAPLVEDLL